MEKQRASLFVILRFRSCYSWRLFFIFIIFLALGSLPTSSSSSAFWLLFRGFSRLIKCKVPSSLQRARVWSSDGFFLASANRLPYCWPLFSPHPWLLDFSYTTTITSVPTGNKRSTLPQRCYSFFPRKIAPSSFLSLHWKLSFPLPCRIAVTTHRIPNFSPALLLLLL